MQEQQLATHNPASHALVPAEFAEKAMASVMQMHSELMDEKERRVELYRKLMEREQLVAELRMYVKLLEEKAEAARPAPVVAAPTAPPQPQQVRPEPPTVPQAARPTPPTTHSTDPSRSPPLPPRVARPRVEGWKTW